MSIVGTESKYKDYKGQEVIHSLPIRTSTLEGEIIGESNKRPGQYDWMFSDSSWYPEEAKKRNRFLSFCTYLNPNKRNSIFLPYFTIGIYAIYSEICFPTCNPSYLYTDDQWIKKSDYQYSKNNTHFKFISSGLLIGNNNQLDVQSNY